jgi:hypothetical protein
MHSAGRPLNDKFRIYKQHHSFIICIYNKAHFSQKRTFQKVNKNLLARLLRSGLTAVRRRQIVIGCKSFFPLIQ